MNATAGTTVLGAYDPLPEIADIAHKYGLWAHLDACWGGHAFLSKKYRHLLKGAEKVSENKSKFERQPEKENITTFIILNEYAVAVVIVVVVVAYHRAHEINNLFPLHYTSLIEIDHAVIKLTVVSEINKGKKHRHYCCYYQRSSCQ